MTVRVIFCHACERPGAERVKLGFIADDGGTGEIAGFACRACRYIWDDPSAEPVIAGHVDLNGQTPMEWFLSRLTALGCNPRPRWP